MESGKSPPVFCFHYLHDNFHLDQCDKNARAAFAMALVKRSSLTWDDLARLPRHKLGWELIPGEQLRMTLPDKFSDSRKVMVMRYDGMLPMAGVRVGQTFHVLAIEAKFNDLLNLTV